MVKYWKDSSDFLGAHTYYAKEEAPAPLEAAAVCIPALGIAARESLPGSKTVKGGELEDIRLALAYLLQQRHGIRSKQIKIFTDNKDAVQECKN